MLLLCELQRAYDTWYETVADQRKLRGRALIIANYSFATSTLNERRGTEADVQNLKTIFEWLMFEVDVRNNLTSHVRYVNLTVVYLACWYSCWHMNFN